MLRLRDRILLAILGVGILILIFGMCTDSLVCLGVAFLTFLFIFTIDCIIREEDKNNRK